MKEKEDEFDRKAWEIMAQHYATREWNNDLEGLISDALREQHKRACAAVCVLCRNVGRPLALKPAQRNSRGFWVHEGPIEDEGCDAAPIRRAFAASEEGR